MLFNIPRRFLLSPTLIDTPRSSFIHLVPPSASNTPSLMFSPLFRSSFHSNILTTSTLHLHTRNSRKTAHIFLLQNYRRPERSRPQDSLLSSHPRNDPWPASQTTDDWTMITEQTRMDTRLVRFSFSSGEILRCYFTCSGVAFIPTPSKHLGSFGGWVMTGNR